MDYILELLVIVGAFSDSNRNWNKEAKAISDKAWKQAQDIVHGKDKDTCGKLPVKSVSKHSLIIKSVCPTKVANHLYLRLHSHVEESSEGGNLSQDLGSNFPFQWPIPYLIHVVCISVFPQQKVENLLLLTPIASG